MFHTTVNTTTLHTWIKRVRQGRTWHVVERATFIDSTRCLEQWYHKWTLSIFPLLWCLTAVRAAGGHCRWFCCSSSKLVWMDKVTDSHSLPLNIPHALFFSVVVWSYPVWLAGTPRWLKLLSAFPADFENLSSDIYVRGKQTIFLHFQNDGKL